MATAPYNPTLPELTKILERLLDEWDADRAARRAFQSHAHAARVGTIHAFAVHAHRLGRAVLTLLHAGLHIEAVPLIRAAYETAITSAWIQQIPDALPAYLNRNHNQQQALRNTALKANWAFTRDVGVIPADVLDRYKVSPVSGKGARSTEVLCDDLEAGAQAYSVFRGLSWYTHPTALVTDLYLAMRENADLPTLLTKPMDDDEMSLAWVHIMCSSLVWSARTLNLIDRERRSNGERNRLRAAAAELHIVEYLLASRDAIRRGKLSEQARAIQESARSTEGDGGHPHGPDGGSDPYR